MCSSEKTYACDSPNCGKTFYYRHHLLRHQTTKHGRVPRKKAHGVTNTNENENNILDLESDWVEN